MGLTKSLLYRRCGAEDETSAYNLRECEDLASHVHWPLAYRIKSHL